MYVYVCKSNPRLSTRKNTAKFVELPLDELELKYDPQWLQDRVVSGQKLNVLSVPFVPNKIYLYQT